MANGLSYRHAGIDGGLRWYAAMAEDEISPDVATNIPIPMHQAWRSQLVGTFWGDSA